MDYIGGSDLDKCLKDFSRVKPSFYSIESSLTKIQWDKIEEEKRGKFENQYNILRSYNGRYFKDSLLIKDIKEDAILAVAIIPTKNDCHYELQLSFMYNKSFRDKLLNFGKGGNSVKFEGKIVDIESYPITLELISIEKGCFIATACYGDYNAPEVVALRQYRDEKLLKTFFGKLFVNIYYFISPHTVLLIENSSLLKNLIRMFILNPIVKQIQRRICVDS